MLQKGKVGKILKNNFVESSHGHHELGTVNETQISFVSNGVKQQFTM
jgi:hypothetical protein